MTSLTTTTTTHPTQVQLESALKSTLHALSLILSFYSSIQHLNVAHHTRHAPRQLTNQLKLEAAKYDQLCGDLETRILRAIAALERDALKAAGQLVLPAAVVASSTEPISSAAPPTTTSGATESQQDAPFPFIDLSTPPVVTTTETAPSDINMNDASFPNTSLNTTDHVNSTTSAILPTSSSAAAPSTSSASIDVSTTLSSLGLSVPAVASSTVDTLHSLDPTQDISALLGIVNDSSFTTTAGTADPSSTHPSLLPMTDLSSSDLDLNAMLSMLSQSQPSGGTGGEIDLPALGGAATSGTGMDIDLENLDFSTMDAGSLDELLKSLGSGTG